MAEYTAACRRRGLKATHQRLEILRELSVTDEHPDAESVYRGVRRRIPAISLDTVYRTLRLFEEQGVITRVGSQRERTRFDANTERHHHFVCTHCGRINDFYSAELDHVTPPAEVESWGAVNSVYVELRGICQACLKNSR